MNFFLIKYTACEIIDDIKYDLHYFKSNLRDLKIHKIFLFTFIIIIIVIILFLNEIFIKR